MTYFLGIDLGTTYTAAAVWRDGRVEIANLGTRAPVIPSVVLLRDDGTFLTGEAAARRAVTEPERIAREFKRRFGDPTPIMVGGTPYAPDALTARLLRWVVDKVSEREGGPPAGITVSHPANWGPYKQDLLQQVFRLAELDRGRVSTVTEPEAAAIHYASQQRVEPGEVVAVYDLGGGTFDAAVLRRTDGGWEVLGDPEGVERLGGIDFDQAVFHHVSTSIDDALQDLDPDDPAAVSAVARLRQECVEAKEALASDVDVTIPVLLPNVQADVRLTRSELEMMIRPALGDSIAALRRALASAQVEPDDVRSVLLVGGSSRLPLVAQMVGSELRRPVAVDAHPKHGVALGAAIVAAERGAGRHLDTEVVPSIETILPATTLTAPAPQPPPPALRVPAEALSPAVAMDGSVTTRTAAGGPRGGATAETRRVHVPAPPTRRASSISPAPTVARAATPGRGSGVPPGSTGPRSRPVAGIVAGLIAVALLVAIGVVLMQDGGGDDDDDTQTVGNTSATEGSQDPTPSTESTPSSEAVPAGPTVDLQDVAVVDVDGEQRYQVTYTVANFDPLIEGGPDSLHIHFFLDTTSPENAGTNGPDPGSWNLTDEPASFVTDYGPANKGAATEMCTVVATVDHGVHDPAGANCLPLPV